MRADGRMKSKLWGWARGLAAAALVLGVAGMAQEPQEPMDGPANQQMADPSQMAPAADPPSRVGRLSFAEGNVSVEPASVNQFSPAEVNDPLTTGDRVWADTGAVAEVEAGQLAVRMGQSTDLTVTAMTDTLAQFGLAQGSVHLRTYALDPGTTTELDTPNVAVTVLAPGDVRVDVDPNQTATVVTVLSGQVEVDGNGLQQTMNAGQSVRLAGEDPVSAQWLQQPASDPLDQFSADRDQAYDAAMAAEQSYVNPDTVGVADLQEYGSWDSEADYGDVWFPTVAVGWEPYCYGRWTWVAPWGWTWVESEPWGFAPFHYGRWAVFGGRWGWIPGPPIVHPVYAPALVVFVHPGNGVSAWFPLGPNEPYAPWYHASTLYTNRVNVSNIYTRNFAQVRAEYNVSNREIFANALGGQRQFVNRGRATVAVPQQALASGQSVRQAQLHLPADQLSAAPVTPHPMVTPERTMVAPAAARAVPPRVGRPSLTSHEDAAIRAGAGPRQSMPMQPSGQAAPVERRGYTGAAGYRSGANAATGTQPNQQPNPGRIEGGVQTPNPARGTEQLPQQSAPAPRQQPNGEPAQEQLYNRAVPPPSRPSFDEQRQAIQSSDPGRPLSPQQMNNIRENRPAGQPQTREAAPHPASAPAPRSEPPRSSPPPAPRSDNNKH